MNKAYKFRIYPNKEQKVLLSKTFGCTRFIYNKMLEDKIKYYEETKKKLNNTPAQYKKEYDKFYPSSKMCSHCGSVKEILSLSQRTYICDICATIIDRDYNAGINIRNEGMRIALS